MRLPSTKLVESRVASYLVARLDEFGFDRRASGILLCSTDECQQIIDCGATSMRSSVLISLGFRVRFPDVEELLSEMAPNGAADPYSGTFGALSHVINRTSYPRWTVTSMESIDPLLPDIANAVINIGLPFLRSHCSRETVIQRLQSDTPRDWLALGRQDRIITLSALNFVLGKRRVALEELGEYLQVTQSQMPKKWADAKRLRDLLAQLEGDQGS